MNPAKRFVAILLGIWGAMFVLSLVFEPPHFRAWERLYDRDSRRFLPSRQIEMVEMGDLGYKSWIRALQHPRRSRFTTDRWGFRNASDFEHPRIVVIGDSYVAGSGLSDDETITSRLGAHLGEPVYNFATQHLNGPALYLRDPRFARQPPEIVIFAPVARAIRPRPLFYREWERPEAPRDPLSRHRRVGSAIAKVVERANRDNRLVRELRFLYQGLRYAWSGHPQEVHEPGGNSVLALSLAEQNLYGSPEQRGLQTTVQMLVVLDQTLRRAGVRLVFMPIPESGTIYPELFSEEQRRWVARPSFLERLLERAREEGIEVFDLRPVFRQNAVPYLFQPDDSHWNARATDLAAEALAGWLRGDARLAARVR
jgi:hypothetical protein